MPKDGGGAEGARTPDLLIANEALSQLSYSPVPAARNMLAGARQVNPYPGMVSVVAAALRAR
jgi:hypothetical protein